MLILVYMEAFRENISQAAEVYEASVREGRDFNAEFRISPDTDAATKIGWFSRIRGQGTGDQKARVEVARKILQNVTSQETDSTLKPTVMIQDCQLLVLWEVN